MIVEGRSRAEPEDWATSFGAESAQKWQCGSPPGPMALQRVAQELDERAGHEPGAHRVGLPAHLEAHVDGPVARLRLKRG